MAGRLRRQAAGRLAALGLSVVLAAACGEGSRFELTDVTGAKFARDFALTDHEGRRRTLADFRGKVVAMTFGFTQCPDICPTTLADLAASMQSLGAQAEGVQVLFVTLDPERDPPLLRQYLPAFHPGFLGLFGDAEATARTAKEFNVFYKKVPAQGFGYSVDHTAGTYVFDREGRLRVFAPYGAPRPALLHDLRLLLQGA